MARARNIKPSFFTNVELVDCGFETRLLFIGLWTLADREGRIEDKPKRIKMMIFPGDDVNVEACLAQLEANKFIVRYEVEGVRCIWIPNFLKHQNPHPREKASELPSPKKAGISNLTDKAEKRHDPSHEKARPSQEKALSGPAELGILNPSNLNSSSLNPEAVASPGVSPTMRFTQRDREIAEDLRKRFDAGEVDRALDLALKQGIAKPWPWLASCFESAKDQRPWNRRNETQKQREARELAERRAVENERLNREAREHAERKRAAESAEPVKGEPRW